MSTKMKPNEIRNTLLDAGLVSDRISIGELIASTRFVDKDVSKKRAIETRKKECKVLPVKEQKK